MNLCTVIKYITIDECIGYHYAANKKVLIDKSLQ